MKNKVSAFPLTGDKKKRERLLSFALVIAAYLIIEVLLKTGNLSSLFKSLLVPIPVGQATITLALVLAKSSVPRRAAERCMAM